MEDYLDEDGYPTDAALERIKTWPIETRFSTTALIDFVRSLWHNNEWGWREVDAADVLGKDVRRYYVSTGGWSGNESLIRAWQANEWGWHFSWMQTRRGGHYIFEVPQSPDRATTFIGYLTVGELRERIADLPDSARVTYQRIYDEYFLNHGWKTVLLPWEEEKSEFIEAFSCYATEDENGNKVLCIHAHY
jgi:hypothetical protein